MKFFGRTSSLNMFYLLGPVLDFFSVIIISYICHFFIYPGQEIHDRYWIASSIIGLLLLFFNAYSGSYKQYGEKNIGEIVFSLFSAWVLASLFSISIVYFLHVADKFSRLWFVMVLLIGFICCGLIRIIFNIVCAILPSAFYKQTVYLIGDEKSLNKLKSSVVNKSGAQYDIVGMSILNENDSFNEKELNLNICKSGAQEIWLSMPLEMGGTLKDTIYCIRHQTAELRFFPDISDLPLINQRVSNINGEVAIDISISPMKGSAKLWKRIEDVCLSLIALLLFSPILLAIAFAIKLDSKGPVIFKQYRTGINGKKFKVYKFRSMAVHSEVDGVITQASKNDKRVTRLGSFLRKTSLDELPQFYNVLQGRMSVVGPRPHALAHNEYYKELVESYMQRHKVKPGITGWAQVCGYRGETDTLDKMQKRVQMDIWYICNWSILLDMKIILLTLVRGFVSPNAY